MIFLGVNRLRIVEYFDELKAKVDVCVEIFIAANHQDNEKVTRINAARTEWFKAIDECEKFNLAELQNCENKNIKLEDEDLFKKFIFEFEMYGGQELIDLRLVSLDTYISPGKIECFKAAILVIDGNNDRQEAWWNKLFVNLKKTRSFVKKNHILRY
jgi:hypothetical protein